MNEIELRQLPQLYNRFLKHNHCAEFMIMSAHTNSRFDFMMKSGITTFVGEIKYRTENLEDFRDTLLEKKKYDALRLSTKLIGGTSGRFIYVIETINLILIFDLTDRNLSWYDKECRKNNRSMETEIKQVTDLEILSADFIISKREHGYYRIPPTMLNDMIKLRETKKLLEEGNSVYDNQTLINLMNTIYARVKKDFRIIQDQQRVSV